LQRRCPISWASRTLVPAALVRAWSAPSRSKQFDAAMARVALHQGPGFFERRGRFLERLQKMAVVIQQHAGSPEAAIASPGDFDQFVEI